MLLFMLNSNKRAFQGFQSVACMQDKFYIEMHAVHFSGPVIPTADS